MTEERLTTSDLAASATDASTDGEADAEPDDTRGDGALTQDARAATDQGPSEREFESDDGAVTREPLLPADQTERFTTQWQDIQADFVDQPRQSVEQADALVADLMQRLATSFSNERERLEGQWDRDGDVSTEDLRVALTRYRSFFDRLLSA
jgi:hypothetical protein